MTSKKTWLITGAGRGMRVDDALKTAEQHISKLGQETGAYRELSSSLALDEAETVAAQS